MKDNEIDAAIDERNHPFLKASPTAFVRCKKGNSAPGTPCQNAVYLVRDVVSIHNDERALTNHHYKLDGFEGGVRSERTFKSDLFERWFPQAGDLVTLGTNKTPLMVSAISPTNSSEHPYKLELHSYRDEIKEWVHADSDRGQDFLPVLGICVDEDVRNAVRNSRNVHEEQFHDETFTAPNAQVIPADQDLNLVTTGDRAREVRIKTLRADYRAALEKAIVSGDQFLAQMGEALDGYHEVRRVGEKLSIVKPPIKR